MENHHVQWAKPLFNSYVSLPEGISHQIPLNFIKPPFSYGFPMVTLLHYVTLLTVVFSTPGSSGMCTRERSIRGMKQQVYMVYIKYTTYIIIHKFYVSCIKTNKYKC